MRNNIYLRIVLYAYRITIIVYIEPLKAFAALNTTALCAATVTTSPFCGFRCMSPCFFGVNTPCLV